MSRHRFFSQSNEFDKLHNRLQNIDAVLNGQNRIALDIQRYAKSTTVQHQLINATIQEEHTTTRDHINQRMDNLGPCINKMRNVLEKTTIESYADLKTQITQLAKSLEHIRKERLAKDAQMRKVARAAGSAKTKRQAQALKDEGKAIAAAIVALETVYKAQAVITPKSWIQDRY